MSIYFIRHAQSEFNAAFQPGDPDPIIFDAPLSQLGHQQAIAGIQPENCEIIKFHPVSKTAISVTHSR